MSLRHVPLHVTVLHKANDVLLRTFLRENPSAFTLGDMSVWAAITLCGTSEAIYYGGVSEKRKRSRGERFLSRMSGRQLEVGDGPFEVNG